VPFVPFLAAESSSCNGSLVCFHARTQWPGWNRFTIVCVAFTSLPLLSRIVKTALAMTPDLTGLLFSPPALTVLDRPYTIKREVNAGAWSFRCCCRITEPGGHPHPTIRSRHRGSRR
jgi:hypothetical protein